MKQSEFQNCAMCGKGMLHRGSPFFYRATVAQMVCDIRAIQRQHGLETMLGGNGALATAFMDEDLAQPMTEKTICICSDCAITGTLPLAVLLDE